MNLWTIFLCRCSSYCIFVPGKNTQHLYLDVHSLNTKIKLLISKKTNQVYLIKKINREKRTLKNSEKNKSNS